MPFWRRRGCTTDPRTEPSRNFNRALRWASKSGIEVVRLLLADQRVDPSADDNYAIQWASKFSENIEVVKLLLQDPRVDASKAESSDPVIQEMLAQWKYHPR